MKKNHSDEPDISIVIPVFNEEGAIRELYARLRHAVESISFNYELIFINDGSKDNSLEKLIQISSAEKNVYYINLSRNFGHQIAVMAGLDMCRGKCAVIIDADLQDPPELIRDLYKKYKEGYEVVRARRSSRQGESWFKKVTAKVFYRLLRKLTNVNIAVDTGDFGLIDRKVINDLKSMPEQNKFLRGQIAWLGYRQTQVEFVRHQRKFGKTGYTFAKMVHLAMDGITGFSDKPLMFVSKAGCYISVISFLIIVYAVYSHYVLNKTITGWTSLIISSMFVGGIQLLSIGVIGEYISRINKNVIKRPLYIVQDTNFILEKDKQEKFTASFND